MDRTSKSFKRSQILSPLFLLWGMILCALPLYGRATSGGAFSEALILLGALVIALACSVMIDKRYRILLSHYEALENR